jgi:hypothetical protein
MKATFYCFLVLLASLVCIQSANADIQWSVWQSLGNNVSVSFGQVPGTTTWTWRFQNNGTAAITYMDFYVTDTTGRNIDVFPGTLAPGQIFGGWAAFTAVSPPTISIQTIHWGNSSSAATTTQTPNNNQPLQPQQAAQQAQQQQQALLAQQHAAQQARQQQIINNANAQVNANNNAGQSANPTDNTLRKPPGSWHSSIQLTDGLGTPYTRTFDVNNGVLLSGNSGDGTRTSLAISEITEVYTRPITHEAGGAVYRYRVGLVYTSQPNSPDDYTKGNYWFDDLGSTQAFITVLKEWNPNIKDDGIGTPRIGF